MWVPSNVDKGRWHLDVRHLEMENAGSFAGGGHKLVWHTTEGNSLSGALGALRSKRAAAHFVIDPRTGQTVQLIPLNRAARALAHPAGPETNRANAIQVEIVGFAADTGKWQDEHYLRLAALAVLIGHRFSIPRRNANGVSFSNPHRLSGTDFYRASGHIGHCHVPGNDHTDPGRGFKGGRLRELMGRFD